MHNVSLAFEAAWKVLVVGVILGAGLPALFAVGVRSMGHGRGGDAELHVAGSAMPAAHPVGRLIAGLCFFVVALAVVLGITYIVATGFGKVISFEHVYPTITHK